MTQARTQAAPPSPYADKRTLTMLLLGFSAGLPIMLIFSTLSLWLSEAGVELKTVTMFSWAGLGYSFKFIWAPLVDTLPLPLLSKLLGRRRAWLLASQLLLVAAMLLMAASDPAGGALGAMAAGAVLLGFSSATQDIAIDACRIEMAPGDSAMQSAMSATYTVGYRIGMICSGAGSLKLASYLGSTKEHYLYGAWQQSYWLMAALSLVGIATTLWMREPAVNQTAAAGSAAETQLTRRAAAAFAAACAAAVAVYFALSTALSFAGRHEAAIAGAAAAAAIVMAVSAKRGGGGNTDDKLRLLLMFAICISLFVMVFRAIGAAGKDFSPLALLGWECLRLGAALAAAAVAGRLLVALGAVPAQAVAATWIEPLTDFFRRYGKNALLLLALIGLYRISDIVAGVISNVFYSDLGYSKDDIANAVKTFGVVMSIAGGLLGGVMAQRFAVMKMMMFGAVLASLTNLLFVLLANSGHGLPLLYAVVGFDNLAAGLASTVFVAFLSALTNIRFTAVQYALFSSLMTLLPKTLGGYSGTIVEKVGYGYFFTFTAAIGLPVLLLIWLAQKRLAVGQSQPE